MPGTCTAAGAARVVLASVLFAAPGLAQDGPPPRAAPGAQTPAPDEPHPLARWLDAETFKVSARYDYIDSARDETVQNRVQTQVQIRAALKVDEAGRLAVHAGLTTGDGFRSGWNATGIGTGEGNARVYLTQLFVAAKPWSGIELQYGSLDPARGASTEITTYDDDGYVTAGRLIVRRPRETFFDDITVSAGYLGYLDRAFVFDRTGAFSRQNYWQVLASKRISRALTLSTDYSVVEDDGILRQGLTWQLDRMLIDRATGEYGVRLRGGSHQTAFAFTGEKKLGVVTVEAGYANVDPVFGVLNGDPYDQGTRVFTSGSVALPLDLSATWFVQKEIDAPITSANDVRVDVGLTWNVLEVLRRARVLPGPGLDAGSRPQSRR